MLCSPFDRFPLGKSGLSVSRLGFGSLIISPLQANLPPEAGGELISYAYSKGVNYVDTAQLYSNYAHIRAALPHCPDLLISTKTYAYTKELAVQAVEEARQALNRDYIDIFMLHEQESEHTIRGHQEALDYLRECKSKGIIRALGLSTHFVAGALAVAEGHGGLDILHPILNKKGIGIVDGTLSQMEAAVEKAHQAGIGIIGMKALGGGNLHHMAGEALSYVLHLPFVDTLACGMQSEAEVDANLYFLQHGAFPPHAEAALRNRKKQLLIENWCVGCGSCVPACKGKALRLVEGRCVVDKSRCVLCGYCSARCKEMAIKIF